MQLKEAREIVGSEFGNLEKEDKSQFDSIVSLLVKNTFGAKDIKEARKDGIKFTLDIMRKHGTAKTFDDRIKRELKS